MGLALRLIAAVLVVATAIFPAENARPGFVLTTLNRHGTGPVLDSAVRRGQVVTISGTGLQRSSGQATSRLELFLAGQPVPVMRAETGSEDLSGDEITFRIPPDAPRGCYVPVQVRLDGSLPGNVATLAIEPDPGECSVWERYMRYLRRGGRSGFVVPFRLSMFYGSRVGFLTGDGLMGALRDGRDHGIFADTIFPPPPGCCTVCSGPVNSGELFAELRKRLLAGTAGIDAGPLHVGPTAAAKTIPLMSDREAYYGVLGGILPRSYRIPEPLFLKPGPVAIRGTGGADLGPFELTAQMPEPISWTNSNQARQIDRDRNFTLHWQLRDSTQWVVVAGISIDNVAHRTSAFLCIGRGADRRLTVPSPILQTLPPSRGVPGESYAFLFLATVPNVAEYMFPVGGMHAVTAIGASFTGRPTRFR